MTVKKRKRKTKKPKLSPEEKTFRRKQRALKSNIRSTIKRMGFEYLRTEGKHKTFGVQKGEFDSVFLYKNVILFCEDSLDSNKKDHIKNKSIFYADVENNFSKVLKWLKEDHKEKFGKYEDYSESRYKYFFLYFHTKTVDDDIKAAFPNIYFIDDINLKYFMLLSNTLKLSSIQELFKFLNLKLNDIGAPSSAGEDYTIETSIIMPEYSSGFSNIPIVSFMMKAEDLMDCAYVLRKENWEDSMYLYQRLIKSYRIKGIRKFIATEKRTFINNIIVSLPNDVEFIDNDGKTVNIQRVAEFKNYKIRITKKYNTIGIIDGQHRVFAHFKAPKYEKYEEVISEIRSKHHLIVTGLIFPKSYKEAERRKFESEIFLEINSNQRKVAPALLQHIESLKEINSPTGIAYQVLKLLNKRSPFSGMFQMSEFEKLKIKTPSILKYGLKDIVEINEYKETLFKYWDDDEKGTLLRGIESDNYEHVFDKYIDFCVGSIAMYFSSIRDNYLNHWIVDKESKLLSATSIIAFLITLRKSLVITKGIKGFKYYKNRHSKLNKDFSKRKFGYVSSQWNRFVEEINKKCWDV